MEYFFDTHFHAMTLAQPSFISFIESIQDGLPEFLTSGALSPSYILTPANRKGSQMMQTLMNALSAFERPIGQIFAMMEDDLLGKYERPENRTHFPPNYMYPDAPYIREGKLHFRNRTYSKLAMCPLVMDFSEDQKEWNSIYYKITQPERIMAYAKDTVEGIDWYYKNRPQGLFEFYPILGINPAVHDADFVGQILDMIRTDGRRIDPVQIATGKAGREKRFYGVKIYPPLGTNPWPSDPAELEKMQMIYQFCVDNDVPIVTHCDDQGFRGIPAKTAWQYTAPMSWRPVFEHYPMIKVDFAHFGKQYSLSSNKRPMAFLSSLATKMPDSGWFYDIVTLMKEYPGVYADLSFSGSTPEFYANLLHFINDSGPEEADAILSKTMFGSDFSVNLTKVESYTNYYRIFEQSPFSDDQVHAFTTVNPMRFYGIDTEPKKRLGLF